MMTIMMMMMMEDRKMMEEEVGRDPSLLQERYPEERMFTLCASQRLCYSPWEYTDWGSTCCTHTLCTCTHSSTCRVMSTAFSSGREGSH